NNIFCTSVLGIVTWCPQNTRATQADSDILLRFFAQARPDRAAYRPFDRSQRLALTRARAFFFSCEARSAEVTTNSITIGSHAAKLHLIRAAFAVRSSAAYTVPHEH